MTDAIEKICMEIKTLPLCKQVIGCFLTFSHELYNPGVWREKVATVAGHLSRIVSSYGILSA